MTLKHPSIFTSILCFQKSLDRQILMQGDSSDLDHSDLLNIHSVRLHKSHNVAWKWHLNSVFEQELCYRSAVPVHELKNKWHIASRILHVLKI